MDKIKKQHYVPRVYLRNFLADVDKEQVWFYDKATGQKKKTSIMNVAQEKFFYDFPIAPLEDEDLSFEKDEQVVENFFSTLEGDIKAVFKRIFAKYHLTDPKMLYNVPVFSESDQIVLSLFMVFQWLRTRDMRNFLTEFQEKAMTTYVSDYLPSGALRNLRIKLRETSQAVNHANVMFTEDLVFRLVTLLFDRDWIIGVNTSDQPFYTSDTPVVFFDHGTNQPVVGGFGKPEVEIVYPLSSNLALTIRDSSYFQSTASSHNKFREMNESGAQIQNNRQVIACDRWVFCKQDSFEQAESLVKQLPKKNDGNRIDAKMLRQKYDDWLANHKEN